MLQLKWTQGKSCVLSTVYKAIMYYFQILTDYPVYNLSKEMHLSVFLLLLLLMLNYFFSGMY